MNEPGSLAEIFKPIPGFKNVQINADGTIVIVDNEFKDTKINTCKYSNRRYTYIRGKMYHVSRLVALTFVPNPKKLKLAILIDGDATNCAYTNLEWGTHHDKHKRRVLNSNTPENTDNLLTEKQAIKIAGLLRKGVTAKALAAKYNTSHATITRIRKRFLKEKHGNLRYHRDTKEHVFELFDKGFTPAQVARMTTIRYETLWKWSKSDREKVIAGPSGHLRFYQIVRNTGSEVENSR